MRSLITGLCLIQLAIAVTAAAAPADDHLLYQKYFLRRFPGLFLADFANGAYAIDKLVRDNWEAIEEFPPYDPDIDEGERLWNTVFPGGGSYADCFEGNPAQRKNYPRWDPKQAQVVTLALAVNDCRQANGVPPLEYGRGDMARLLAYMAYESRGQVTNVVVPADQPEARDAYDAGKRFYFSRRGQLNFACANCHMESAGQHLRTDTISPSLGHTTGWPTYRSDWGDLGTLHLRFQVCT